MKDTETHPSRIVVPPPDIVFLGQAQEAASARVSPETFSNIAHGRATEDDVEAFNAITEFRNRAVLARLTYEVATQGFDGSAGLGFVHGLDGTLSQARQKNPTEFRTAWTYPFFNGFTGRVRELLTNKGPQYRMPEPVASRMAYETGATVAAVAIRCDVPCDVGAYVHDRRQLMLPSVGALQLPTDVPHVQVRRQPDGQVLVGNSDADFCITLPHDLREPTDDWQPVRTLHAEAEGCTMAVTLDDLHYNRSAFADTFTGRLPDKTVDRWQTHFQSAWEILVRYVPEQALATAGIVRTIIPYMTPARGMYTVSHSAAYGAIGLSMPDTPVNLAKEILHEGYGHNVLDKLHDAIPLPNVIRYDNRNYYSPWRRDPRPYGGHAHGMYAHTILANFCRVLSERGVDEGERRRFAVEFARWRAKVGTGSAVLGWDIPKNIDVASSAFLTGMFTRVRELQDCPVEHRFAELAQDEVTDHYLAWTLANRQVPPESIAALAEQLLGAGKPGAALPTICSLPEAGYVPHRTDHDLFAKHDLFGVYQNDPGLFKALQENPSRLLAFKGTISTDVALINGEYERAAEEYGILIRRFPGVPKLWPGFLTALGRCYAKEKDDQLSKVLLRPEVLYPLYALASKDTSAREGLQMDPETFIECVMAMLHAGESKGTAT